MIYDKISPSGYYSEEDIRKAKEGELTLNSASPDIKAGSPNQPEFQVKHDPCATLNKMLRCRRCGRTIGRMDPVYTNAKGEDFCSNCTPTKDDTLAAGLERCINECDPYLAHLLKFFRFDHLPTELAVISCTFASTAIQMVDRQRHALDGPEATMMLRKLLEAKDCAVRAAL